VGNGGSRPVDQMIVIADKLRPFDAYSHKSACEEPVSKK